MGDRRLSKLGARRVDGAVSTVLVMADDCLLAGCFGVPSLPGLGF